MGANEARHVLDMVEDLSDVLALEIYTAAQALEYRQDMLNAARRLADRGDRHAVAAKINGAPPPGHADHAQFEQEVDALMRALSQAGEFRAGDAVRAAFARVREVVGFMQRDRPMDAEVQRVCALVRSGVLVRGG